MPNKKKLDFDVKRYLVAEVLYPDHVVPLHVAEWKDLSNPKGNPRY